MNLPRELRTDRLLLRLWRPDDREPFARLNADPRVVEFLPKALTREESDAVADRIEAHFERHGFGLWAVEIPGVTRFAGFIGLSIPRFEAHFTPCIEIGWRLATDCWNRGYATEGAVAATDWAFDNLGWTRVIHSIAPDNVASQGVARKLGSRNLGPGRLPAPFDNLQIDIWGQTQEEWARARERRTTHVNR